MKIAKPTAIGLISGSLMVITSLIIFHFKGSFENGWQYISYSIYIGSVLYAQKLLEKKNDEATSFKNYFSEGFKVFIVVTLLMVLFTWMFLIANPSLEEAATTLKRADLLKSGNRTLEQIETEISNYRKRFVLAYTSAAIFGYLMIGALAAVMGGLLFKNNVKQQPLQ